MCQFLIASNASECLSLGYTGSWTVSMPLLRPLPCVWSTDTGANDAGQLLLSHVVHASNGETDQEYHADGEEEL